MCRFMEASARNQAHLETSENGSKMWRFTTHSHTSNLQGNTRLNMYTADQTITSRNLLVVR